MHDTEETMTGRHWSGSKPSHYLWRYLNVRSVVSITIVAVILTIVYVYYGVSEAEQTGHLSNRENQGKSPSLEGTTKRPLPGISDNDADQRQEQIGHLQEDLEAAQDKIKDLDARIKRYPEVKFLSYKDRKRILITGGAGFVGSHLVDALMLQGHEVTVVDNFFTGRRQNVDHWIGHENFELLNHDIVNPLHVEVNEIYHLASPASPPHYMYNPIKTIKTNTVGTINMLGLAKRVHAKLLLASTSEVYGDPEVHPQPETYWGHVNPNGPRACYDEGKRVAETMCYAYMQQSKLPIRVARIFNTFGPRMHMNDGRVVSNFILQALQSQPITIYGDGKQTRSFQYVTDLVNGLIALMNSNFTQPVNIGNPEEYTINDFAVIIQELVGGVGEIVHKPAQQDDPKKKKVPTATLR